MKQFKQILLTGILMFAFVPAVLSQAKRSKAAIKKTVIKKAGAQQSQQLQNFLRITNDANVSFYFPQGFKEIKAPDNEDVSFDYAMELPGKEFEIWFQVRSLKENWAAYQRTFNDNSARQANPDSVYINMAKAQATAFAGDTPPLLRNIPSYIAARYNADAGKSYIISLPDEALTKHYRYALLITLQKDHIGTIMAVCFANQKGPEFFKNIDRASNCIKFKL